MEHMWEQVVATLEASSVFFFKYLHGHPCARKRHVTDYNERLKRKKDGWTCWYRALTPSWIWDPRTAGGSYLRPGQGNAVQDVIGLASAQLE